jgi:small-conductance mechanosensitive channel
MSLSLPAERSVNWTMTRINEDNLLNTVVIGSIVLSAIMSLAGCVLFSWKTGLGIAAGSSIATINFIWQRNIMQRVLGLQLSRPTAYASARYLLRLSITAVLLYFILTSGLFSITGLLVGLSVIVMMIVLCTVYFAIQHKGD